MKHKTEHENKNSCANKKKRHSRVKAKQNKKIFPSSSSSDDLKRKSLSFVKLIFIVHVSTPFFSLGLQHASIRIGFFSRFLYIHSVATCNAFEMLSAIWLMKNVSLFETSCIMQELEMGYVLNNDRIE
ncbi:CLUMA_CG000729, isoform A [Clunio marinus]|uniref:CLUMA_CG000729, isoform A n=1 Tax=Clunio marinus TaxID=568069 RepID=A0A1J1HHL1_9DIPT|nr:CLUMA_CG000729, isoform A [Clunio marinus]